MRDYVTTSESVTAGHPDKLCDQISDAVVDAYLTQGIRSGVVAECAIATGVIFLSVRASEEPPVDLADLTRAVVADAGYPPARREVNTTVMVEFSRNPAPVMEDGVARHMTSAFGYACKDDNAMPAPVTAAHRLARALDTARREGRLGWLSSDAQAQVAVAFRERRPVRLDAIALTFGTAAAPADMDWLETEIRREVIAPAFHAVQLAPDANTRLVLRPLSAWGGPEAHSGLTGRKTADDAYGGFIRRGGAALSGKDPARADRIAAYAARHAARLVVAAGIARECEVQISYLIGDRHPTSIEVDSYGTGQVNDHVISGRLRERVNFSIGGIAERMGLWDLPGRHGGRFYRNLATYGHMGRMDLKAPWEDVTGAATLA